MQHLHQFRWIYKNNTTDTKLTSLVLEILLHNVIHWFLYWRCSVRELHITSAGPKNGWHLDHILEKLKDGPTRVILLLQRVTDHNLVVLLLVEYHTWLVSTDHFYLTLWSFLDLCLLHQILFNPLCWDVKQGEQGWPRGCWSSSRGSWSWGSSRRCWGSWRRRRRRRRFNGWELPSIVVLDRAVAWKPRMGPNISSVHTVLTQEGHLQQQKYWRTSNGQQQALYLKLTVEVSPLVSKEASDNVETMLVSPTWLSRTPVKPLGKERIEYSVETIIVPPV